MSLGSSGLIKIISRASTMLYLSAWSVRRAKLLQFCQAGWNLGVFRKLQLRNCVGDSNLILRKTPHPTLIDLFLKVTQVTLRIQSIWSIFLSTPCRQWQTGWGEAFCNRWHQVLPPFLSVNSTPLLSGSFYREWHQFNLIGEWCACKMEFCSRTKCLYRKKSKSPNLMLYFHIWHSPRASSKSFIKF